jgi:hypothetical protein
MLVGAEVYVEVVTAVAVGHRPPQIDDGQLVDSVVGGRGALRRSGLPVIDGCAVVAARQEREQTEGGDEMMVTHTRAIRGA